MALVNKNNLDVAIEIDLLCAFEYNDNKCIIYTKNEKELFEIEKINFENFCREEMVRLETTEKELNIKMEKINNLIGDMDKNICKVINYMFNKYI